MRYHIIFDNKEVSWKYSIPLNQEEYKKYTHNGVGFKITDKILNEQFNKISDEELIQKILTEVRNIPEDSLKAEGVSTFYHISFPTNITGYYSYCNNTIQYKDNIGEKLTVNFKSVQQEPSETEIIIRDKENNHAELARFFNSSAGNIYLKDEDGEYTKVHYEMSANFNKADVAELLECIDTINIPEGQDIGNHTYASHIEFDYYTK
ncbi:MAG: hypothetical protein J0H68_05010 [Sphingobacteriia bacterium]|nr:hypothetical protein [Sphingobacteriia bacterium]